MDAQSLLRLANLCRLFDKEKGSYPESEWEGLSVLRFCVEETYGKILPDHEWAKLEDRWASGDLEYFRKLIWDAAFRFQPI